MAYRELGMWEVLDVLRRVHRGEAKASIERVTGRTRKTIRRYLAAAAKAGWEPGSREPDEALAAAVSTFDPDDVHPGACRANADRFSSDLFAERLRDFVADVLNR